MYALARIAMVCSSCLPCYRARLFDSHKAGDGRIVMHIGCCETPSSCWAASRVISIGTNRSDYNRWRSAVISRSTTYNSLVNEVHVGTERCSSRRWSPFSFRLHTAARLKNTLLAATFFVSVKRRPPHSTQPCRFIVPGRSGNRSPPLTKQKMN